MEASLARPTGQASEVLAKIREVTEDEIHSKHLDDCIRK